MNVILRSHRYPEKKDEEYINSTHYDKDEKCLDLGYQQLKKLILSFYPEFSILKKLFIDHNCLTELPEPKYLPHLEELTCSVNILKTVPFYPKLIFLNFAHNKVTSCELYHNSRLIYLDCSHNPGLVFSITLPYCTQIYINDNLLDDIDLNLLPKIEVIDCSNNNISNIDNCINLLEINIQHNNMTHLPKWVKLQRLMANDNKIKYLIKYPNLITANVSNNKIIEIHDQPLLKKLIADNNRISKVGLMPNLELIDFTNNNITSYDMPDKVKYISIQFNPITKLDLNTSALQTIRELQINFDTYVHIHSKYYEKFNTVNIKINEEKLETRLKRLNSVFNDAISRMIYRKFNNIDFKNRDKALEQITMRVYWTFYSKSQMGQIEDILNSQEFKQLLKIFKKFYYDTIVVTLYFNDYEDQFIYNDTETNSAFSDFPDVYSEEFVTDTDNFVSGSASVSGSGSRSGTQSGTQSATRSGTQSATRSRTQSGTQTESQSGTQSVTRTDTQSATRSGIQTGTQSVSQSGAQTGSKSGSRSDTQSVSNSSTQSVSKPAVNLGSK